MSLLVLADLLFLIRCQFLSLHYHLTLFVTIVINLHFPQPTLSFLQHLILRLIWASVLGEVKARRVQSLGSSRFLK